jgi:hypothetical protein
MTKPPPPPVPGSETSQKVVEAVHARLWDKYSDRIVTSERDRDDVGAELSACITAAVQAGLDARGAEVGCRCRCGEPAEFVDHWCGSECPVRNRSALALTRADNERLQREVESLKVRP